jgi:hypothetical protein
MTDSRMLDTYNILRNWLLLLAVRCLLVKIADLDLDRAESTLLSARMAPISVSTF